MSRRSIADRFLDFVTLNYDRGGDLGPHVFDEAGALLERKPDLPRRSIYTAAAAGDVEALEYWKAEKPKVIDKPGGPPYPCMVTGHHPSLPRLLWVSRCLSTRGIAIG